MRKSRRRVIGILSVIIIGFVAEIAVGGSSGVLPIGVALGAVDL